MPRSYLPFEEREWDSKLADNIEEHLLYRASELLSTGISFGGVVGVDPLEIFRRKVKRRKIEQWQKALPPDLVCLTDCASAFGHDDIYNTVYTNLITLSFFFALQTKHVLT